MVPVKQRSFSIVAGTFASIAILLCGLHYLAVAWPAMVYRPELSRPFRLDMPDSFGRFFMAVILAGSAGAALMIYQLRRYRLDDYLGRYRLWRLVLIVTLFASVNSLVSILDWTGAILDASFGKRVALSGSDWIGIVVGLGSGVLALRMVAEVRRYHTALVTLLAACGILLIPQAARWNVMSVEFGLALDGGHVGTAAGVDGDLRGDDVVPAIVVPRSPRDRRRCLAARATRSTFVPSLVARRSRTRRSCG